MAKFYEHFSHRRLWQEALALGVPPALMRVAIATYGTKRVLRAEGGYEPIGRAARGLPPGDSIAGAMVVKLGSRDRIAREAQHVRWAADVLGSTRRGFT